jgi:hypothetical protein
VSGGGCSQPRALHASPNPASRYCAQDRQARPVCPRAGAQARGRVHPRPAAWSLVSAGREAFTGKYLKYLSKNQSRAENSAAEGTRFRLVFDFGPDQSASSGSGPHESESSRKRVPRKPRTRAQQSTGEHGSGCGRARTEFGCVLHLDCSPAVYCGHVVLGRQTPAHTCAGRWAEPPVSILSAVVNHRVSANNDAVLWGTGCPWTRNCAGPARTLLGTGGVAARDRVRSTQCM